MEELKERIIELEIRYAHQNSTVEELNAELTSAHARIDNLERTTCSVAWGRNLLSLRTNKCSMT